MENLQLPPGSLFANRFEIRGTAGSGGMGTVYRARDHYSSAPVALKLLHRGAVGSDDAERFAREAQLLAELRHPNIVAYVAHGQTLEGQRFLAMEWLEGEDLAQRLCRGSLPLRDALLVVQRTAEALSVAHERRIVHRDLKPTNLFLPAGEISQLKLLDFGIARRLAAANVMTRTGTVVGSPEYMAPEQARGERELTSAADIFSLGCVLYECLTGEPPFVAEHIAAVLVRILFEEPVDIFTRLPDTPLAVAALLRDMLTKDPARRIADAAALLARLAQLGAVPELTPSMTLAAPIRPLATFAKDEQALFSLVVAAEPSSQTPLAATLSAENTPAEAERRTALLAAVRALGARADYLVDGALIVTMPQTGSARDQVAMAARIALLIKDRWTAASVSVTTGRGAAQGATPVGEVADRAMQILERCRRDPKDKPKESVSGVWVDELSVLLLGPSFAVSRVAQGALLVGEERGVDESRPLLGKPTPCVGRDAELSNLEGQLNSCIEESEGRVILITAPPGVGKSRLRHEFLRRVQQRSEPVTVLLSRGDLMNPGAPFGILEQAVRRLCGLYGGEPAETQQQRLRARIGEHIAPADRERLVLFLGQLSNISSPVERRPILIAAQQDPKIMQVQVRQAFIDWLRAECRAAPVLLIVDDLQWGDALSVGLIDDTLRELRQERLLVVALGRPEMHETFPKLWQAHRPLEVPLKGLSKKAAERLVQHALGRQMPSALAARLIEQSGGNALFLEELIRSASEGRSEWLPETVVAMLQARIGRLDAGPRRAVLAASVYGQTFWLGGVAAVLGRESALSEVEQYLSELSGSEVIEPHSVSQLLGHKEYAFRHALVRDAAYGLLSDADRATGHRLAGQFLEAAGEPDPAIFAEHFELGGARDAASRSFLSAAAFSIRRNDFQKALSFTDRAEALGVADERRVELHSHRGEAYAAMARWGEARDAFQTAAAYAGLQSDDRRAELLVELTATTYWGLDVNAARGHAAQALALAEQLGRDDLTAATMSWLGMISTSEGDVVGGLDWFQRSHQRTGGQKIAAMQPLLYYWLGQVEQGCQDARRVVELARSVNDVTTLMMALPSLALNLAARCRYAEAVEIFAEARDIGNRHKITTLLSRSVSMEAGWQFDVFDYQGAQTTAVEAYELAHSVQYVPPLVSSSLDQLFVLLRCGEVDRAEARLLQVRELIEKAAGWHEWIWNLRYTLARAEIDLERAEFRGALVRLATVINQEPRRQRVKYQILGLLLRARAFAGLGQLDDARVDLRDAVRLAQLAGNQALLLRAAAASLTLDHDPALHARARAIVDDMSAALGAMPARRAFEQSEIVRRIRA